MFRGRRDLLNGKPKSMHNAQCIMHNYLKRENYELCIMNYEFKKGFTLAEVLITLAIIGVVAAITMPTLIQHYRVVGFESALKKSYNTITNGFHMIAAESGGDLRNSGLFDNIDDDTYSDRIDKIMRKYFKVIKSCKIGDTENCPGRNYPILKGTEVYGGLKANNRPVFYLADGTILSILNTKCAESAFKNDTNMKYRCAYINFDTNGEKGPNVRGKDYFQINMDEKGNLHADVSLEWAKASLGRKSNISEYGTAYWRNDANQCGHPNVKLKDETISLLGTNCIARIIENGWEMDYLK